MAFQAINSKALMLFLQLVALIFFSMAAAAPSPMASSDTAPSPSPSPSMDTGAGYSTPLSAAVMGFSIVFSFLALFKH
ncbi:hypothetical protein CFP56_043278 [Quercus suber]|uniref:Transmembrane protein n=1 Tax=Quercus suber TaxID=58331 RepID=A0AAW0ISD6_QUESU|nr:hypothetical protein CFP56_63838 [Quercus suber]